MQRWAKKCIDFNDFLVIFTNWFKTNFNGDYFHVENDFFNLLAQKP